MERVVCYQSRHPQPTERNYPVHEFLAMKYALTKFRIYLFGYRPFIVYTDHASLLTAFKSPHLSQRMARWLTFVAEYNFSVEYKLGRLNIVADAISCRHNFEPTTRVNSEALPTVSSLSVSVPSSPLLDDVRKAYEGDLNLLSLMDHLVNSSRKTLSDLPLCTGPLWIDIRLATGCCTIQPLPTTRLVSSYLIMIICA